MVASGQVGALVSQDRFQMTATEAAYRSVVSTIHQAKLMLHGVFGKFARPDLWAGVAGACVSGGLSSGR